MAVSLFSAACAHAADGDLDPTFGNAGKLQFNPALSTSGSYKANDTAIQADGKTVIAGEITGSGSAWVICRFNVDGSLDTGFVNDGQAGCASPFGNEVADTRAHSVAIRPNGKIVIAGTIISPFVSSNLTAILVIQLNADGSFDNSFGHFGRYDINPSATDDSVSVSRLQLDSDGTVDLVGTYYLNTNGFNSYQFFFDRIAADGSGDQPFRYQFGGGPNEDAHATDFAIDAQGRYVVTGYAPGAHGYDCEVIRITRDLYDVDRTFAYQDPDDYGVQTIAFDYGGDDNDICNAVAVFPGGFIAIGGHATAPAGSGTYQAAVLAELDGNGIPYEYFSSGINYPAKFAFSYALNPVAGQTNDIARLIVDRYDTQRVQLIAIGTGNQYAQPAGVYLGIARINPSASFSNFTFDTTLNGKGVEGVFFAERPTGFGSLTTTNGGLSGAFANGALTAAGYTQASGGDQFGVTRLEKFDGIFKNSLEAPSY
jgi:uncharacterized delta-60 repeat protein